MPTFTHTQQLMIPALFGYLLTFTLVPASIKVAHFLHAVDMPGELKIHKKSTPRFGGVAIFTSMVLSLMVFPAFTNGISIIGRILLGMGLFSVFLLGVFDDIKALSPGTKFSFQIVSVSFSVAGLACLFPDTLIIQFPAIFIFILLFTNSFNLIDGMDGLAGGIALIMALSIGIIASISQYLPALFLSILIAGCTTGFLFYNLNPARIFLGDCGSTFLGFSLAILLSMLWLASGDTFSFFPLLLIASTPLLDTIAVVIKRTATHQAIFAGDRNHLYDRLLQKGCTLQKTLLIFYAVTILSAAIGVTVFLLLFAKV